MMTIGRFARLTGLSIGTLRHYDDVGLLPPASVDPASGYRRYCRDQISRARQIAMLAVDDVDAAVEFYVKAFGFRHEAVRRTEQADYSAFIFGAYGQDDFFLTHLITGQDRMDLPGPSTFGLLVEDLDAYHARAVDAGATEVVAPHDAEGMPRNSAVRDPSGNWIGLAQA